MFEARARIDLQREQAQLKVLSQPQPAMPTQYPPQGF